MAVERSDLSGKQSGNAEVKVAMVQRMIAVYAFVFALVQMGQQKTKAFFVYRIWLDGVENFYY